MCLFKVQKQNLFTFQIYKINKRICLLIKYHKIGSIFRLFISWKLEEIVTVFIFRFLPIRFPVKICCDHEWKKSLKNLFRFSFEETSLISWLADQGTNLVLIGENGQHQTKKHSSEYQFQFNLSSCLSSHLVDILFWFCSTTTRHICWLCLTFLYIHITKVLGTRLSIRGGNNEISRFQSNFICIHKA